MKTDVGVLNRSAPLLLLLLAQPLFAQKVDTLRVVVDSARMHLFVSGSGSTTVVLEAGAAGDSRTWVKVQPPLSRHARVVSYDRLGYGQSQSAKRPRTAAVMAEQLREGLRNAGIAPPYLLVAHSFGGIISRVFAGLYPSEVMGLVLVDPALETFYSRAATEAPQAYLKQLEEDLLWAETGAAEPVRREYLGYEASLLQARLASLPAPLSMTILSASKMELAPELLAIWLEEHARWAEKVGARRIVVDHGHRIPQERPELVVNAVTSLLR